MKTWLLSASALAGGMAFASAAFAQDVPPVTPDSAAGQAPLAAVEEAPGEAIVVTGTRLRIPNLASAAPITTVTGEQFFQTGQVSVGDVLNELPQLRSTFGQQNSTRFLGTRGLNLLDLRGLGTERTLVLVNGRRHVGGDVLASTVSPDTNTFPTDLLERVDLISGGGSAVYGSDAIAGAVNFVLKQNYEGLQIRGQSGVSKYKDAGNQYVSMLAGKNFAEGRGNVAVNLEYSRQNAYYGSNRPNLRQADQFVVVDTDPAGATNGSDGVPDRVFLRDVRSTTGSSLGGLVLLNRTDGTCGRGTNGTPFTCNYLFQPDGSLALQTGQRVGIGPNGSFLGGNGPIPARDAKLLTLSPQLDRYSANAIGHFEVSPAFVPFFEAKYVRSEAKGSQSGPFFINGSILSGDVREQIRLDNPYLSAQARSTIEGQLRANGGNPTGATRFGLRRTFLELGIRDENFRRETYRGVAGIRGDFNDDWNYEVSVNYGRHKERNLIVGDVNQQRYVLAVDTVRNAAGQIVCRSQVDPAARTPFSGADGDPALLARDIAACVPLNPFGEGTVSQAARDYVVSQSQATGKLTQFVASGYVSGDLSQLFELPGGPVAFSVGGEYRKQTASYDLDDLTQAGYNFYNAIPSLVAPAQKVKEAFGEISIPILKDVPFFQELTLSGQGRISDYNGATGTVYTYGGEVSWRPIRDFRVRGTYNRAIRAPNLSELFSAQGQNFTPAPNDPCSARNIGTGSSTRAANCAAAGRPANFDYVYTASLEIISGGNPNLREEKSDNYTVGAVYTPSYVPGLSVSVDYYDLTVKNVISSVDAQDVLNNCYDAIDLNNAFCRSFQRAGAGGGPRQEQPFQILEGTLLVSSLNFAKLTARGIDANVNYTHQYDFGRVSLQAVYTRILERSDFLNPADPSRADRIMSELGDPRDALNVNASVERGKVTLGYQFRWIGKQVLNFAEDTYSVQGRPPQNADYADIRRYGNVFYHDARVNLEIDDRFNIYVGMDNITNRMPPFGLTGVGAGSGIYDVRGRYGYVGAVAKF